jgi:hypothetical protein
MITSIDVWRPLNRSYRRAPILQPDFLLTAFSFVDFILNPCYFHVFLHLLYYNLF